MAATARLVDRLPGPLRGDAGGAVLYAVLALLAIGVPILELTPESSPLHLSPYVLTLLGKYLCYAMLALAVDLIWGYCGILSLGHAAFFSLGGYAMGMYLMRQIGTRGVYGDPVLPDFMVFLNWKSLPWFWTGFDHFWVAMAMVVIVPGLLALAFGWLAFRSRVTGVYFSIITQAMSFALMLAFFRNDMGFGGNNGFTDFKDILGFPLGAQGTRVSLVVATVVALAASYAALPRPGALAGGAGHPRHPRRREPDAVPRLPGRALQAVAVRDVGGHRRHRRRALRAAGRHHQPRRVRADQLDRGGDLGRGRRPRHALRRRRRARSWSTTPRPTSRRRSRRSGSTPSARCSSLVTLLLPRGIVGLAARCAACAQSPRSGPRSAAVA